MNYRSEYFSRRKHPGCMQLKIEAHEVDAPIGGYVTIVLVFLLVLFVH